MTTFLFVDDEKFINEWYQELFEKSFPHARLHFAGDGQEAFDICRHCEFSLIITDVRMPRLDGIGFARKLRSEANLNKATPIIIVSAFITFEMLAAYDLPNLHSTPKPVKAQRLIELCSQLTGVPSS